MSGFPGWSQSYNIYFSLLNYLDLSFFGIQENRICYLKMSGLWFSVILGRELSLIENESLTSFKILLLPWCLESEKENLPSGLGLKWTEKQYLSAFLYNIFLLISLYFGGSQSGWGGNTCCFFRMWFYLWLALWSIKEIICHFSTCRLSPPVTNGSHNSYGRHFVRLSGSSFRCHFLFLTFSLHK